MNRNISTSSAHFPSLSIAPLLHSLSTPSLPFPSITTSILLENGTPLFALSTGSSYSFSKALGNWIEVSKSWWRGSKYWNAMSMSGESSTNEGVVRVLERSVEEAAVALNVADGMRITTEGGDEHVSKKVKLAGSSSSGLTMAETTITPTIEMECDKMVKGRRTALSRGLFESRLHAAIHFESATEYRQTLLEYCEFLVSDTTDDDEEEAKALQREKCEEIVREFLGTIY